MDELEHETEINIISRYVFASVPDSSNGLGKFEELDYPDAESEQAAMWGDLDV